MGGLAIFLALISDATRHRVHIWACWIQIGAFSLVLVETWLPYLRKRGDDLPRALVVGGISVLAIILGALNLYLPDK
jgi:hypothetical protein